MIFWVSTYSKETFTPSPVSSVVLTPSVVKTQSLKVVGWENKISCSFVHSKKGELQLGCDIPWVFSQSHTEESRYPAPGFAQSIHSNNGCDKPRTWISRLGK